jgi:hypothetical protein
VTARTIFELTLSVISQVEHSGIRDESKIFENSVNTIVNRVYKREYTGQPADFFLSSVVIS